ncbi:Tripartite ATP-independent periplasmic transporter DctQ component [Arcobacter nitrofigilis DSM 7299]|uniref:Tripartite ATP-independent periplasmic transporter DctQ component n=1 Tax=Arcobacter nitrofigilis (strain ATCC 33309 / DSM 7299 / CCUG 15893 / LMG 7604 / NCTC 12251 / CI) TaxID=572480 RepID=D5V3G8_ARCNC|nr:TRAP transporter small permease [Arcobacter nitrofigilis]ADG91679.1 Tripartite ATP-independent periplasmic transporter DctQ component [Arcobacter nitrofigilis DSM 7299]
MENSELKYNKLDRLIISIGRKICIFYIVCFIIICYEVFSRYVLNSPTSWVQETTTLIAGILFIWGGLHSLTTDRHIKITILYDMLTKKYKYYVDILISTLLIICLVFMNYSAFLLFKSSWFKPWGAFYMETSGSAWNPPFPAISKLVLFVVLILMLIQVLVKFISILRRK